jgi:hypothetical protein
MMTESDADKNAKRRVFVIKEIISTELTYLERLKITIDIIITPLRQFKIIAQSDIIDQFSIIEKMHDLHQKLYNDLIAGEESDTLNFGEIFGDFSKNFRLYSEYLINYEPALQKRASLLISNRKFADFVELAQKDPKCQNLAMESFLILPVQRIPRYKLLLEQLLKYTEKSHADYESVSFALEKISEIAMLNNEAIRERENMTKLMAIMMQFDAKSRIDLLEEKSRVYIRDAQLQRQCRFFFSQFFFTYLLLSV